MKAVTSTDRPSLYYRFGKRLLDVCLSAIAIILLLPLFAAIAALVKCTSQGPVFFLQDRIGRDGHTFKIVKFRSMIDGADRLGLSITASGDKRITRIGTLLRKLKLDELPQLWNVLSGDMSLVGPRPELPAYVAQYSLAQRHVLSVRPGITDPASIRYRHEEEVLGLHSDPDLFYRQVVLPHKLSLNLEYVACISLRNDSMLLLRTISALLSSLTEQRTAGEGGQTS
jgi:lipopolysaccharide/colanic/teichoic acid biosynthesis glycosyltransferase